MLIWNVPPLLGIMRMRSPLLGSPITALALTAAVAIVILFTANVTLTNAQQQPPPTSQPALTQNETSSSSLFQSTEDGFKVRVPQGWVIRDMDNTGFSLLTEVFQGYAVLAQLCPEQQQQAAALGVGSSSNSCQASQGDIIHIIRYPNLGVRLGFTPEDFIANSNNTLDNILSYEIQKLQEVGYRDIQIVNSTYTTVNFDINTIPAATVPGKLVEMTYTTDSAPNEIRRGYFISTATDATPHNLGTITGYSIFYEGNSAADTVASDSLSPTTALLPPVRQVFDSFELVVGEVAAQAPQTEQTQGTDETNDGDTNNNNDNGGNDNDNGGNDNDNGGNNNECVVVGRPQSSASDNCDETADDDGGNGEQTDCDSSYPDVCIPPPPPNLNCDDISERNFEVRSPDPHGFDGDNDGIGCESGSNQPEDQQPEGGGAEDGNGGNGGNNNDGNGGNGGNNNENDCVVVGRPQSSSSDSCE
jgi:hypothetical protein